MTVTTRRERRQKQKRQQQRRRGSSGTNSGRLLTAGVVAGLVLLVVLGLAAAGVFDPAPAKFDINDPAYGTAGQTIGTRVADLGKTHIPVGQKAAYNSVPPTSGEHWSSSSPAAPAPWGVKDAMLPNEVTVHNLEHGGIVIAYNGLTDDQAQALKSIVRTLSNNTYRKIILEPYPPLTDAKIALTAWDWILKLDSVDQTQVVKFVRAHYQGSDAPEATIP